MFHIMRNMLKNGTKLEQAALELIRKRLPPNWNVQLRTEKEKQLLSIKGPNGKKATFLIIARKNISPKDIANLLQGITDANVLLTAPFLSPRSCDLIVQFGANFVDATGNLKLVASDPAVYLNSKGEDQDPQRQKRKLKSLKGPAAARVVRALCDFLPPYGVRTLAEIAPIPLGTASRVITLLEEEALLTRDEKKQIIAVDWPSLITRWARDYNVMTSNRVTTYLEPRNLPALITKFKRLDRYAVTGSIPGPNIAPARLGMIYVDDAESAAQKLELTPADAGSNVWLLEPYDEVVFERTQLLPATSIPDAKPIVSVAMSQLAVDLMTSPGRGPQEAQALIEQMKETELVWRKQIRS